MEAPPRSRRAYRYPAAYAGSSQALSSPHSLYGFIYLRGAPIIHNHIRFRLPFVQVLQVAVICVNGQKALT